MSVDVESVAYLAARQVHSKYSEYLDLEDVQQEALLWVYGHPERVESKLDRSDNEGAAANWLRTEIASHLESLAVAEKARAVGYEVDDLSWYSAGVIALVLPKVLTGDRSPPPAALDGSPRGQNDPAEGGVWMALYADVSKAFAGLESDDQHLLSNRYFEDLTFDAIARRWGWGSSSTAQAHVKKAEGRLIAQLGGYKPQGCQPGCTHWDHDERLRRRPDKGDETW